MASLSLYWLPTSVGAITTNMLILEQRNKKADVKQPTQGRVHRFRETDHVKGAYHEGSADRRPQIHRLNNNSKKARHHQVCRSAGHPRRVLPCPALPAAALVEGAAARPRTSARVVRWACIWDIFVAATAPAP